MRLVIALFSLTALLAGPVFAGVEGFRFTSEALGRDEKVVVYVPNTKPPVDGWPVLYLLHGLGGRETDWVKLGGIEATLDALISDGQIRPAVVVMPDGDSSWYVDSGGVGGPGDYERMVIDELIPQIEASYAIRADRDRRMIAGLSMGGYGALRLALAHPDLFGSVAGMSAAIWQNIPAGDLDLSPEKLDLIAKTGYFHTSPDGNVTTDETLAPTGRHFHGAFGTPFDARRFNKLNVFTLLRAQIADGRLPRIYLTVGDDDGHQLWRGSIAFFDTLRAAGQDASLRITDGDHTWQLWRVSIRDVLIFLLAPAGTPKE